MVFAPSKEAPLSRAFAPEKKYLYLSTNFETRAGGPGKGKTMETKGANQYYTCRVPTTRHRRSGWALFPSPPTQ